MATGRSRHLAPWLALPALWTIGCAQPGPFTSRQTMVGSLKASVSQLEFENEKLRKEVGELKADNSRLDNMRAQAEDANNEMAARLDDAKDLLRRQGGNAQALGAPPKNFEDDGIPPPVTIPQGRRTKSSRKPPTTRIPTAEPEDPPAAEGDSVGAIPANRRSRDLGPDGQNDDDRWLPVARGLPSTVTRH